MPISTSQSIYCLQKTDTETVSTRVLAAFKDYLDLYWRILADAQPLTTDEEIARVKKAQIDYDQYSAERDPAPWVVQ